MFNDVVLRLNSLGYTPTENDNWLINLMIRKVENYIKDFCNIRAIPKGLRETAINMVCGEFLIGKKAMGQLPDMTFEAVVKQITEGDTTVSFGDSMSAEQKFDALMASMTHPDQAQFIRYRKLVW
mgnify:FL=1